MWQMSLLTELKRAVPSQAINISPRWGWNFQIRSQLLLHPAIL